MARTSFVEKHLERTPGEREAASREDATQADIDRAGVKLGSGCLSDNHGFRLCHLRSALGYTHFTEVQNSGSYKELFSPPKMCVPFTFSAQVWAELKLLTSKQGEGYLTPRAQ